MLSFFPRDVLGEVLDLIMSVFEDLPACLFSQIDHVLTSSIAGAAFLPLLNDS